ncbi:MAG: hypothetical protein AMK75_05855, partial [Planctomycetes bacterium SM23_65]
MFRRRLRILLLLISTAVAVIVGKLYYLQVLRGDYYRRCAEQNIAYKEDLETRRGNITDRTGVPLAVDEFQYDVCLYLRRLERLDDPRAWCAEFARLLDVKLADVSSVLDTVEKRLRTEAYSIADRTKSPWKVELKWLRRREQPVFRNLSAVQIRKLEIGRDHLAKYVEGNRGYPVFVIREVAQRQYPRDELASHIVGYVGPVTLSELKDQGYEYSFAGDEMKKFFPDDVIGRAGVEAHYEADLRGARGMLFGIKDVHNRWIENMPVARIEPRPGRDLRLTIDARLQRIVEEILDEQIRLLTAARHQPGDPPICGAVVLIDPYTGDVLAAASAPRFNLNHLHTRYDELRKRPGNVFFHRATVGTYPIGSTFKIVVAVAALEENVISGHTEFTCHGSFSDGSRILRCTGAHSTIELTRAIEQSCNVYFWNTGLRVGARRLKKWAEELGLGQVAYADVREARGFIPLCVSRPELLNLAIGQGRILCTPLQVARAMGCVALAGELADTRFCMVKPVHVRRLDMHPERVNVIRWG